MATSAAVVEARGEDVGVAQPLLNLCDIGPMGKRVGRGQSTGRLLHKLAAINRATARSMTRLLGKFV
jgi:hypothetical protein